MKNTLNLLLLCYVGVEQTGETEWDRLWQLFLDEENPQDKHNMMVGLCNTKEPSLIQRYVIVFLVMIELEGIFSLEEN